MNDILTTNWTTKMKTHPTANLILNNNRIRKVVLPIVDDYKLDNNNNVLEIIPVPQTLNSVFYLHENTHHQAKFMEDNQTEEELKGKAKEYLDD